MADEITLLLVPVDGSEGATAAARYAGTLASLLRLPIELLFVFPATPVDLFGMPIEGMSEDALQYFSAEAFAKLREDAAAQAFGAARAALGNDLDVPVAEKVLSGRPAKAIVDHADAAAGAMIVMGRRGLSRLREMMLGSVSQGVVHAAACPVTLVR